MIIGHKQQIDSTKGGIYVVINGENIQRAHEVRYLGVNVDENLNWNRQYNKQSELSSLRKLRNMLPQSKSDQVYGALVKSHLRYGNELWGSLSATKLENLKIGA